MLPNLWIKHPVSGPLMSAPAFASCIGRTKSRARNDWRRPARNWNCFLLLAWPAGVRCLSMMPKSKLYNGYDQSEKWFNNWGCGLVVWHLLSIALVALLSGEGSGFDSQLLHLLLLFLLPMCSAGCPFCYVCIKSGKDARLNIAWWTSKAALRKSDKH